MWSCCRLRCVGANIPSWKNTLPLQLRLSSEKQNITNLEHKKLTMWNRQADYLVRKRKVLSLISDYVQLQERYVDSRLRSNKVLLDHAIKFLNTRKKETT